MSCNVLVIPEDPQLNGYILSPVIAKVLAEAGRPRANVRMLSNPRTGGFDHAMSTIRSPDFIDRYRHLDFWVFVPDADRATEDAMAKLRTDLAEQGITLLTSVADPELEAWLLAASWEGEPGAWRNAKASPRFKEQYFAPFLERHGNRRAPGGGRAALAEIAVKRFSRVRALCPELDRLVDEFRDLLADE